MKGRRALLFERGERVQSAGADYSKAMRSTPPRSALLRSLSLALCFTAAGMLVAAESAGKFAPVRIKTGVSQPLKDETGVTWLADTGFKDGDIIEREGLAITNTKTPSVYRAERYSMTAFSHALPNGKYVVKLHFAETFEGISGPKQRVFSFNVEGKEFKDFDVWVKAGGFAKAYIETVEVEVKDGKLDITFTPNVENPEINALEILPAS